MLLIQIWNRLPIGRDQSDALPRALADAAHRTLVTPPRRLLDLRAPPLADDIVVCTGGDGAETTVDLSASIILIVERIGGTRTKHPQRMALARALGEAAKSVLGSERQVRVLVRDSHPKTDAHWSG